jgi:hypothetical protein
MWAPIVSTPSNTFHAVLDPSDSPGPHINPFADSSSSGGSASVLTVSEINKILDHPDRIELDPHAPYSADQLRNWTRFCSGMLLSDAQRAGLRGIICVGIADTHSRHYFADPFPGATEMSITSPTLEGWVTFSVDEKIKVPTLMCYGRTDTGYIGPDMAKRILAGETVNRREDCTTLVDLGEETHDEETPYGVVENSALIVASVPVTQGPMSLAKPSLDASPPDPFGYVDLELPVHSKPPLQSLTQMNTLGPSFSELLFIARSNYETIRALPYQAGETRLCLMRAEKYRFECVLKDYFKGIDISAVNLDILYEPPADQCDPVSRDE